METYSLNGAESKKSCLQFFQSPFMQIIYDVIIQMGNDKKNAFTLIRDWFNLIKYI